MTAAHCALAAQDEAYICDAASPAAKVRCVPVQHVPLQEGHQGSQHQRSPDPAQTVKLNTLVQVPSGASPMRAGARHRMVSLAAWFHYDHVHEASFG
jgi:hypothetical protein